MNSPTDGDPFRDADERLADWVDGRLSPRDRERFEAEMRVSPRLREQAETYRRSVQAVQAALRVPGPRVDLADRVLAKLREQPAPVVVTRPRAPWRPLPILASLAAAAMIVISIVTIDAWSPGARSSTTVADKPELADALRGMVAAPQPEGIVAFTAAGGLVGQGEGDGGRELVLDPPPLASAPADLRALMLRATNDGNVEAPSAVPGLPSVTAGVPAGAPVEAKAGEAAKTADAVDPTAAPTEAVRATVRSDPVAPVQERGVEALRLDGAKGETDEDKVRPDDVVRKQDLAKGEDTAGPGDAPVAKSMDAEKAVPAPGRSGRGAALGNPKAKSREQGDDAELQIPESPGIREFDLEVGAIGEMTARLRLTNLEAAVPQVPVLVVTSRLGTVSRWMESVRSAPLGAGADDLRTMFATRTEDSGQWLAGLPPQAPVAHRLALLPAEDQAKLYADKGRTGDGLAATALPANLLPTDTKAASGWFVEGSDEAVAQVLRQVGRLAKAEGFELSSAEIGEPQVLAMAQAAREQQLAAGAALPASGVAPTAGPATAAGRTEPEPKPAPSAAKPAKVDAEIPPRRIVLLFRELPPLPPSAEPVSPPPATGGSDGRK